MEQLNNNEYNILVVEDDKEIRDGIEIFLKSQGYHVYKAADGVEGLEVIDIMGIFHGMMMWIS